MPTTSTPPLVQRADEGAAAILKRFWSEGTFPVDPVRLAKRLGILVYDADLAPDVSGGIMKASKKADVTILLDRDEHPNRRRFTCAHELGHWYENRAKSVFEYVDYRSHLSSTGLNESERFANAFAAALLMPASAVAKSYKKHGGDEIFAPSFMANEFGVSLAAMEYRILNLKKYGVIR